MPPGKSPPLYFDLIFTTSISNRSIHLPGCPIVPPIPVQGSCAIYVFCVALSFHQIMGHQSLHTKLSTTCCISFSLLCWGQIAYQLAMQQTGVCLIGLRRASSILNSKVHPIFCWPRVFGIGTKHVGTILLRIIAKYLAPPSPWLSGKLHSCIVTHIFATYGLCW